MVSCFNTPNCFNESPHEWGKWEEKYRRVGWDGSAVHERECLICGYKELE
jgi:hypothetical protein